MIVSFQKTDSVGYLAERKGGQHENDSGDLGHRGHAAARRRYRTRGRDAGPVGRRNVRRPDGLEGFRLRRAGDSRCGRQSLESGGGHCHPAVLSYARRGRGRVPAVLHLRGPELELLLLPALRDPERLGPLHATGGGVPAWFPARRRTGLTRSGFQSATSRPKLEGQQGPPNRTPDALKRIGVFVCLLYL